MSAPLARAPMAAPAPPARRYSRDFVSERSFRSSRFGSERINLEKILRRRDRGSIRESPINGSSSHPSKRDIDRRPVRRGPFIDERDRDSAHRARSASRRVARENGRRALQRTIGRARVPRRLRGARPPGGASPRPRDAPGRECRRLAFVARVGRARVPSRPAPRARRARRAFAAGVPTTTPVSALPSRRRRPRSLGLARPAPGPRVGGVRRGARERRGRRGPRSRRPGRDDHASRRAGTLRRCRDEWVVFTKDPESVAAVEDASTPRCPHCRPRPDPPPARPQRAPRRRDRREPRPRRAPSRRRRPTIRAVRRVLGEARDERLAAAVACAECGEAVPSAKRARSRSRDPSNPPHAHPSRTCVSSARRGGHPPSRSRDADAARSPKRATRRPFAPPRATAPSTKSAPSRAASA